MTSLSGPATSAPGPSHPARRLWWSLAVLAVLIGAAIFLHARSRGVQNAAPGPSVADTRLTNDGVVAYYFHTTYRCTSCRKIETYSRLAIETGFAGDIASGRLQIRLVNIEDEGNRHYVHDYQLYTKSLVLSERAAGREVRWKNLTRVWELLNDEPAFVDYVQRETRAFLAETP
ncbi:MAG TPA: nitrophenyl compound nitroreductase subunit ArsF family protein [Candidatus Krumholzibacteria bacterium]